MSHKNRVLFSVGTHNIEVNLVPEKFKRDFFRTPKGKAMTLSLFKSLLGSAYEKNFNLVQYKKY